MAKKKNNNSSASQVLKDSAMTSLVVPRVPDDGYTKEKMRRATGAYQTVYNQISKKKSNRTPDSIKEQFGLTDLEYRTICSDAASNRAGLDAIIEELKDRTKELTDIINNPKEEADIRFEAFRTRSKLKKFLSSAEMTFGGRVNMRNLSYQNNVLHNAEPNILKEESNLISLKSELERLEDETIYVKHRRKKIDVCKTKIKKKQRTG